jgi:hypothetical protein
MEELLGRKSSGSGPEIRDYVEIRHSDHVAPSICKKFALTSPTSGGRSVGAFRSWTKAMEFVFLYFLDLLAY